MSYSYYIGHAQTTHCSRSCRDSMVMVHGKRSVFVELIKRVLLCLPIGFAITGSSTTGGLQGTRSIDINPTCVRCALETRQHNMYLCKIIRILSKNIPYVFLVVLSFILFFKLITTICNSCIQKSIQPECPEYNPH